jgi:YfiH family protein
VVAVIERVVGAARVIFTDRRGGVSRPPYDSANLAHHVGDDPDAVEVNRVRAAATLGIGEPARWAEVRQVHGNTVVRVGAARGARVSGFLGADDADADADALVTSAAGVPLVIYTADCAPVALITEGAVAAVHAGWAGLEAGVVERAVAALRAESGGPVRAVLGPCIHAERYEFGRDLLDRLVDRFGPDVARRTANGAPAFDIPAAVRAALAAAGVDEVDDVDVCTAASPDHFSYRRDGVTGRQAMFVVHNARSRR